MCPVMPLTDKGELILIDSIFDGIDKKSYMTTKNRLLKIPEISNFEGINFYPFKKYAVTLWEGRESFEKQSSVELKEMYRKIINYCKP